MYINKNNIFTMARGYNDLVNVVMVFVKNEYVGNTEAHAVEAMLTAMGYIIED